MSTYLNPTQEAGRAFLGRGLRGAVVMLNLLRLRAVADYADHPELAPGMPITGHQAYDLYVAHTLPFLVASGGEVLFDGEGGDCLIGPSTERWDRVLIVRQRSVADFMAFAEHQAYLEGLGHRSAAVEDSRLLPMTLSSSARNPLPFQ